MRKLERMYLRLILVLAGFMMFASAAAQQRLNGKVMNEKNEPLQGVSVQVTGGAGTSTNINGHFQLNLATGKKI